MSDENLNPKTSNLIRSFSVFKLFHAHALCLYKHRCEEKALIILAFHTTSLTNQLIENDGPSIYSEVNALTKRRVYADDRSIYTSGKNDLEQ